MPLVPMVRYILPGINSEITPEHPIWKNPLPLSREAVLTDAHPPASPHVSYGDYFTAVHAFVERNCFHTPEAVISSDIQEISIAIEKHGAFYHPACVTFRTEARTRRFVVNVAISSAGRSILEEEYQLLKRLRRQFDADFLPETFARRTVEIPSGPRISMFLAEWFEGFCEFHPAADDSGRFTDLVLWDPVGGNRRLTPGQTRDVYRHAALILTYYYTIETFEQIFDWHHAAGDFVVKPLDDRRVDMKLITVRRYAPLIEDTAPSPAVMVEMLLVFLLNLLIRNRLDRIGGTGPIIWSDDAAVAATLEGFFQALEWKTAARQVPDGFSALFHKHLKGYGKSELYDLNCLISQRFRHDPQAMALIQCHLKAHTTLLAGALHI